MDDQTRDIGHRAEIILLAFGARHARHEVPERLVVGQQLPQLHADPRGIDDAHVERQELAQAVERLGIRAGHPHRIGPALPVWQNQLFHHQHEIVFRTRVVDVDRPRHRAVRAGLRLLGGEQRVEHGRFAAGFDERAELVHAVTHDACERRDDAGHPHHFARGRHRAIERVAAGARQHVELHAQPFGVLRPHVHRERLGDGADAARLLVAVDPHLERAGNAVFHVADEDRETAERRLDHVSPRRIAAGEHGASGPAQAQQCGRGRRIEANAPVGVRGVEIVGLCRDGRGRDGKHAAQHAVGTIGGDAFQPRFPGLEVEVLELIVRIILGHVHRLADGRIDEWRDGRHHAHMVARGNVERGDEMRGQLLHVAAGVPVQPPRVVFDVVGALRIVGHALLALVGPRIRRLDAIRCVVGERERYGASGRDRQQVAVAQAVRLDIFHQRGRQARRELRRRQVAARVEQRKRAFLFRESDRCGVRFVAHVFRDLSAHAARLVGVVLETEHYQGVAKPGEPQPDPPLGVRLGLLRRQRPHRDVKHVVQHAHRGVYYARESLEIEARFRPERVGDEQREIDAAQAAAAVCGQRLFAARIGRFDCFAVREIVIGIDAVDENHARLGVIVGGLHDLPPQVARLDFAIHP